MSTGPQDEPAGVGAVSVMAQNYRAIQEFHNGCDGLLITQRFVIVIVAFWLSVLAISGVSWWGLSSARDSLKTVHEDAMQAVLLADESVCLQAGIRTQVLLIFQHAPDSALLGVHNHPATEHLDIIAAGQTRITALFKELDASAIPMRPASALIACR